MLMIISLLVFVLVSYGKGDTSVKICEPIKIELCKNIGYNQTSLNPHEMQNEVDLQLQTFSPLISYGCSAQLNFFLCAAYLPMCSPKMPNTRIGPCQKLCEAVRARCHPVLNSFGFSWPSILDCNRFPKENNHENMCMEGPGEPSSSNGPVLPNIIQPLQTSCKYLYKSHLYVRLNRSNRCIALCEADIMFDAYEKQLAWFWISSWSVAALFTSTTALICLIFSDTRWNKSLMPIIVCHCLVSVGWGIRILAGRTATSCGYDMQFPGISLMLTDGLSTSPCSSTFLLRYYFGMAASIWIAILCYRWNEYLKQHYREVLGTSATVESSNHDTFFQICGWGLPAIQTIIILVARLIDADELLGTCYVGNQSDKALLALVALPLLVFWTIGCGWLLTGYLSRKSVPKNVKIPAHLKGLGTFLFVYSIPNGLLLLSLFYQFGNRENWLNVSVNQPQPKPHLWIYILHTFLDLSTGILASTFSIVSKLKSEFLCRSSTPKQANRTKSQVIKLQQNPYQSASYHSICPPNSMVSSSIISMASVAKHSSKYPSASSYQYNHKYTRRARSSLRSASLKSSNIVGNEIIL